MTKYLKIVFCMMALFGIVAGTSYSQVSQVSSIATVAQEAACTCYYNDLQTGFFGTLKFPGALGWQQGIDYGCQGGLGNNSATIKFCLSANAMGNCDWQHAGKTGTAPYPNFWTSAGGGYYLQVQDASQTAGDGWTCKALGTGGTPQIWNKTSGGDANQCVEFTINPAASGGKKGDLTPLFTSGTVWRVSDTCEGIPGVMMDTCTLCTNCSTVSVMKTGNASCPPVTDGSYDPCVDCPVKVFQSHNQFATAIKEQFKSGLLGGFSGSGWQTKLFDGVANLAYAPQPDLPPGIDKTLTGFTNKPQTWDCKNNWSDEFCFYFCSNDITCGDYCCLGDSDFRIRNKYLITEGATGNASLFGFDILRKDKLWTDAANPVSLCAWLADSCECGKAFGSAPGISGLLLPASTACIPGSLVASTGPALWKGQYPASHQSDYWNFCAMTPTLPTPTALDDNNGPPFKQLICTLAETTPDKVIPRSTFWLDYARYKQGSSSSSLTGAGSYFGANGIDILPPQAVRFAGEWKWNAYQYVVGYVFGDYNYRTRIFISNKSANPVRVWVDLAAGSACQANTDRALCISRLDPMQAKDMGVVQSQSLKMIELWTHAVPFSFQSGTECICDSTDPGAAGKCPTGVGCPVGASYPIPFANNQERVAAVITVAAYPNDVEADGCIGCNGPDVGKDDILITGTQRDANTGNFRTVNILDISTWMNISSNSPF